jgi:ABC-type glycerol-3-phosphate transport system permease component
VTSREPSAATLPVAKAARRRRPAGLPVQPGQIGTYAGFAIFVVVIGLPFYWLVKSALSNRNDLFALPPVYLPVPTLSNFTTLADQVPFATYVKNSLVFSIATTFATVALSFLAAYAFARLAVRGKEILLWLLVLSMALPQIATIIPLYQTLRDFSLLNSLLGLTLVMSSLLAPFTVWILTAFIKQVPPAIEEAARIDGAGLPRILWGILVPLTLPALTTVLVINFVNAWNELLYPLAFSATPDSKTLSVAITEIFQAREPWGRPWNLVSALGVTMVVPIIVLVLVSQKAIVRGLTRGALK